MTQRWIYFMLTIVILAGGSAMMAQTAVAATDPLRLTVDCARFRGPDDSTSHIEVYYSFSEGALTYKSDSSGLSGAGDITLLIQKKDSLVHGDRWLVPHKMADTSSLHSHMNLVGLYALGLGTGEYTLKVILRDRNAENRQDSVLIRIPVRPVGSSKTSMSDLEFASSIRQGRKESMFYKNTLEVVPNVGGVYGEKQVCYFYAEAYNLLSGEDKSDYKIRTAVYDAVGREVMTRDRARKRQAESTVIVDNFGVDALKSGTYTLVVSVLDSAQKPLVNSARKFFVYNASLGVDSSLTASANNLPLPIYASMDEAELDLEFKWDRYEMGSDEKRQYEELKGAEAKRKFLSTFWRHRTPGLREEYLARASYANANFRLLGRDGYRTDRGRIYITYGPPEDYERHPNESDSRPYEIWTYNNIQGGVVFVFVQRTASGDYELVHSTHRNELHDEDWQRFVTAR